MAYEKGTTIGFLKQDLEFVIGRNILEEAYQAFVEIKKIEVELDEVNNQLTVRTDYESDSYMDIIHRLEELTTRYEIIGGYNYQAKT